MIKTSAVPGKNFKIVSPGIHPGLFLIPRTQKKGVYGI
jgi:hypothetical protein